MVSEYIHIHIHIPIHIHIHTHTLTHTYTYTYTHTLTHTYTHIHVCLSLISLDVIRVPPGPKHIQPAKDNHVTKHHTTNSTHHTTHGIAKLPMHWQAHAPQMLSAIVTSALRSQMISGIALPQLAALPDSCSPRPAGKWSCCCPEPERCSLLTPAG